MPPAGHGPDADDTAYTQIIYRAEKKSCYVVARNFFLLLLNFFARPCLGAA